jgi:hypothetical protein
MPALFVDTTSVEIFRTVMRICKISLYLALSIFTALFARTLVQDKPSYLSALEQSVLDELNLARTNPQTYAKLLEDYKGTFEGKIAKRPGKIDLMTQEGTRAVDEAIRDLKKQTPLEAMRPSNGPRRFRRLQALRPHQPLRRMAADRWRKYQLRQRFGPRCHYPTHCRRRSIEQGPPQEHLQSGF